MYLNKHPGAFWDCGDVWERTESKPLLEGSVQVHPANRVLLFCSNPPRGSGRSMLDGMVI